MLRVCLYAARKCNKFPKVIIHALAILHLLHCTSHPFSALLLPWGERGWPCIDLDRSSKLGSRNGSHWQKPKADRSQGTSPPSLPARLKAPGPRGPPPQSQLSALVISGELRASQSYYSLSASPSFVCSLTSILSSVCNIKDEISFPAGAFT